MEAPRPIKRRRSREDPAERRRKDKLRKRQKRGRKTPAAPVVDGSSTESEDGGNNAENAMIQHPEAYLFEGDGPAATCRNEWGGARGGPPGAHQGIPTETPEGESATMSTEQDQEAAEGLAGQSIAEPEQRNPEESARNHGHYSSGNEDGDGWEGGGEEGWQAGPAERQQGNEGQGEGADSAREHRSTTGAEDANNGRREEEQAGGAGEAPRIPQGYFVEPANPTERLAMALAGVRGSSEVSDSAINKMLKVALEHREALDWLGQGGSRKNLYTKKLRPRALRHIPRVFTAILLEEKVQGGLHYRKLEELEAIPKEYLNLPNRGRIQIIREESYVKLRDIKEHHRKIHRARGVSEEELRNHYGNAAISVDGVEEGNKCKTTFHVVTLRLGSCIYLYKIFNPLVGHKVASPSVEEVLG